MKLRLQKLEKILFKKENERTTLYMRSLRAKARNAAYTGTLSPSKRQNEEITNINKHNFHSESDSISNK